MPSTRRLFIIAIIVLFLIGSIAFVGQLIAVPYEKQTVSIPLEHYYPDRVNIFFTPDIDLKIKDREFILVRGDPNAVQQLNSILQNYGVTRIEDYGGSPRRFFTLFVPERTDLEEFSQTLRNLPIVERAGPIPRPVIQLPAP